MREIEIARNWWTLLFTGLVALVITYGTGALTWAAVQAALAGQPPPIGFSWWSVIVGDLLLLGCAFAFCWIPLIALRTVFTAEGIRQPRLFAPRYLRWADVQRVEPGGRGIRLALADHTVELNPYLYKNREQLFAELQRRIPEHAWRL